MKPIFEIVHRYLVVCDLLISNDLVVGAKLLLLLLLVLQLLHQPSFKLLLSLLSDIDINSDGTTRVWDIRDKRQGAMYRGNGEFWSCSVNGADTMLASGVLGNVITWYEILFESPH